MLIKVLYKEENEDGSDASGDEDATNGDED